MCIYDKEKQQVNCQLQNKLRCGGFAVPGRIAIVAEGIEKIQVMEVCVWRVLPSGFLGRAPWEGKRSAAPQREGPLDAQLDLRACSFYVMLPAELSLIVG